MQITGSVCSKTRNCCPLRSMIPILGLPFRAVTNPMRRPSRDQRIASDVGVSVSAMGIRSATFITKIW